MSQIQTQSLNGWVMIDLYLPPTSWGCGETESSYNNYSNNNNDNTNTNNILNIKIQIQSHILKTMIIGNTYWTFIMCQLIF